MKTVAKVAIGAGIAGLAIFLITRTAGAAATGAVASLTDMQIFYPYLSDWIGVKSGDYIPSAENISLAFAWVNKSKEPVTGHIDAVITYPDGSVESLVAVSNQDAEAIPGDGWYVVFDSFYSSMVGTYTVEIRLSADGNVVDRRTIVLGCPVPSEAGIYTPTPPGKYEEGNPCNVSY